MRLRTRSPVLLLFALAALVLPPPSRAGAQAAAVARELTAASASTDTLRTVVSPAVTRYCATTTGPSYLRAPLCSSYARQVARLRVMLDSARLLLSVTTPPVQPPPPPVQPRPAIHFVDITPKLQALRVGGTLQFTGVPKQVDGAALSSAVTWSASPSSVATISATGLLSAVSAGSVTVSATSDTVTSLTTVTIAAADSAPTTQPNPPPVTPPVTTPPPGPIAALSYGPAAPAQLPQDSVDTTYPTTGRTIKVCSICSLQAAINSAQSGDILALTPGATYVGNFTLPNKGAAQSWIVIRTDTSLSLTGTRMTPSQAAANRLARIYTSSTSSGPVLSTDLGSHHWWLVGLDISLDPAILTFSNTILRFGSDERTQVASNTAHHIIVDRSYVHAPTATDLSRCIAMNSAATAIIHSWVSDCHTNGGDAQAIASWNGPGPFLIADNYLDASHEVIAFGGGTFTVTGGMASDVIIRGNHLTRPLAWQRPCCTSDGSRFAKPGTWIAKTILESKNARRVLVEGNVLENNWADAQAGYAVLIKSEDQYGDNVWTQSADWTIRYNRIRNTGSGLNFAGKYDEAESRVAVYAARISVYDNVIENLNVAPYVAEGVPWQILNGVQDVAVFHNTALNACASQKFLSMDGSPAVRLAYHSNVVCNGQYGISTRLGSGSAGWKASAPGGLWAANVVIGGDCSNLPAGSNCPSSMPSTLPAGYDGRPAGADLTAVTNATRGAVVAP